MSRSGLLQCRNHCLKELLIEPYLNRSDLVGRAIGTVSRNLIEGALIVVFILVLFLGNIRAGLIVASVIPLVDAFRNFHYEYFRSFG